MKKLLLFSCIALAFALSSCAFKSGDGTNAQDRQFEEANNKLKAEYSQAEGLYKGEITRPGYKKTSPVEIRLIVLSDKKGEGSSGKTRQLVTLVGVVLLTEAGVEGVEMAVSFDSETGRLILSNSSSQEISLIDASLVSGRLSGLVTTRQGVMGRLEANLVSKTPDLETIPEKEARLKKYYDKICGTYETTMILNFKASQPIETTVGFTVTEGSTVRPALNATSYSGYLGPCAINLAYFPAEEPPKVSITSSGANCAFSKLEGSLQDGKIFAKLTTILGDQQTLVFSKR